MPILIVLRADFVLEDEVARDFILTSERCADQTFWKGRTAWLAAKMYCQCADGVSHELMTHLGRFNPITYTFSCLLAVSLLATYRLVLL